MEGSPRRSWEESVYGEGQQFKAVIRWVNCRASL